MSEKQIPFSFLTVTERAALSPEDFGDPERRLFPVMVQQDVTLAPNRISFFPDYETLKDRIISIALKKGFKLPDVWVSTETAETKATKATEEAEDKELETAVPTFSADSINADGSIVEFELDASTKTEAKDGEWVYRTGKVFEAGKYTDKKFEISPEEMCEAIADFKPVDLDLEHMPTVLDGKLGKLEAVTLGSDGWSLIGTVRLPKWLDTQLGDAGRKVSATWDRATKRLTKLALVRNPRVKDAAVMAAFMAHEVVDKVEDATESDLQSYFQEVFEARFARQTWDGRQALQEIHDRTSRLGAVCSESNSRESKNDAKSEFVSESESKAIQQIHDFAIKGGAVCNFVATTDRQRSGESSSYYNTNNGEENSNMTFEDVKAFFKGLPDDAVDTTAINTATDTTGVDTTDAKAAELSAREEALAKAEADLANRVAELEAKALETEVKNSDNTEGENEIMANDKETIEEVGEVTGEVENSATAPSARELELEAELEALRLKDIHREAEKFADGEIRAERAYPAERETLVALFTQAMVDDKSTTVEIAFKSGDEDIKLNRVEALKALYAVRKPHGMTYEEVKEAGAQVLLAQYADDEDYLVEAENQAKAFAALRNKAVKKGE